jgi:hypothetical protein
MNGGSLTGPVFGERTPVGHISGSSLDFFPCQQRSWAVNNWWLFDGDFGVKIRKVFVRSWSGAWQTFDSWSYSLKNKRNFLLSNVGKRIKIQTSAWWGRISSDFGVGWVGCQRVAAMIATFHFIAINNCYLDERHTRTLNHFSSSYQYKKQIKKSLVIDNISDPFRSSWVRNERMKWDQRHLAAEKTKFSTFQIWFVLTFGSLIVTFLPFC